MAIAGCTGKALLFLLVAAQLLHGLGCLAEATTAPEEAAVVGQTLIMENVRTVKAAPQHGRGSGLPSALWSNDAGGLSSRPASMSKPAVARRLLQGPGMNTQAGHSCGSSGRQGCDP